MDHLFITILLLLVSFLLATHFRGKYANLPPTIFPSIPIIGHLYLLKKPIYRTLAKLSAKHGPILFLHFGSRRVLVVSSPSVSEECFTKQNDIIFANRPHLLAGKILSSNYSSLGWAPYGDLWRNLRRISTIEVFSSIRLNEFHDVRANEGRLMIRKILSECGSSPVNLNKVFQDLTSNVLMSMIARKRYFGSVDMEDEGKRFQEIVKESFLVAGASNIADHLPILSWMGVKGFEKKLIAMQKNRSEFFQGLIDQLRKAEVGNNKEKKKNSSIIEVLLQLQETDPAYYTDELIKSFILNLLAAGVDTSFTTMEWAFTLLLNHPHVLIKARNEIDNHVENHRLVNESDMANLPYLRCIINETLRLYPAAPLLVPHESSHDCVVGGYHVPRGTMLLINQWAIQHDPDVWSDPEKFDPDRFKGFESGRNGLKFMPFGSGRRSCPGEGLATRVIGLTLGLLIQCFDWERISEEMVDMSEGPGLSMPKVQPLFAKCKPLPITRNLVYETFESMT
uniref:cytochrome P450 81Q32-like n=1 Tax=Erigeron canadensis TaxID=72917 RepID=UPI001CB91DE2|nr:cytochrome P450 81Q32-like [Erigeron canadensis]